MIISIAGGVIRDRVDLIQVSHVYNKRGVLTLDQLLFYDWDGRDYQVRDWRRLRQDSERPVRDFRRGDWAVLYREFGLLREIRGLRFRETWTQYDPEKEEQKKLPVNQRRGLTCVES